MAGDNFERLLKLLDQDLCSRTLSGSKIFSLLDP